LYLFAVLMVSHKWTVCQLDCIKSSYKKARLEMSLLLINEEYL